MSASASAATAPPPPPYYQTDAMDAPLLDKAEPMAAADFSPQQPQQPQPQQQYMPPPPYASGAAPPPQPPTVLLVQPQQQVIMVQPTLSIESGTALCPACQQFVPTRTRFETGSFTWLLCAGMCLVGLNLGCCFIPFCVDACKDVVHECPRCAAVLHRHKRL